MRDLYLPPQLLSDWDQFVLDIEMQIKRRLRSTEIDDVYERYIAEETAAEVIDGLALKRAAPMKSAKASEDQFARFQPSAWRGRGIVRHRHRRSVPREVWLLISTVGIAASIVAAILRTWWGHP